MADTDKLYGIRAIAFDADDTLWCNEPYFRKAEEDFCMLLADCAPKREVSAELFRTEQANMARYGFGAKSFTLSMIETALRLGGDNLPAPVIARILETGKSLLDMPVQLLDGVKDTLEALSGRYELAVATKGDLLDQQRKLARSGIAHYFFHVEILSDKTEKVYARLAASLGVAPGEMLVAGNSLRSDVLPALAAGAAAVYIPFEVTWQHEIAEAPEGHALYRTVPSIAQLPELLG